MQATENTAARWEEIIADLTNKALRYESEIAELTRSRDSLALDAELGQNGAKAALHKLQGDINTKRISAASVGTAIKQASVKLKEARAREAAEAERGRQREVATALRAYYAVAQKIDTNFLTLAASFAAAREHLDAAESLMSGEEPFAFNSYEVSSARR